MQTCRLLLVLLTLLATPLCLPADRPPSMRPSLVALQVADLDASIRWYTTHLEFVQRKRREFPEHGLELAMLDRADFTLELVENRKTVKKSDALAGKGTDITGFAKLTFTVADVAGLFAKLRDAGASFAIELRDSNTKPGEQFFVVLDPENNWLQFVGRK